MALKKYRIYCEYTETVEIELDAKSKKEAEDKFFEESYIDGPINFIEIEEINE